MSFVVYKSSAGSGKTFTIVKEYLSVVLREPTKYRRILAITFTNKAANEMKERVLLFLRHLADIDENKDTATVRFLLPDLIEETGLTAKVISENANKVITLILHNYSDFAISTIDSFVHRIVRTFALDLRLPMNFEVELDASQMIEKVVDYLLSEVGRKPELTTILLDFILSKTEQDRSWNPEADIASFVYSVMDEEGMKHLKSLRTFDLKDFLAISKEIEKHYAIRKKQLESEAAKVLESIAKQNLKPSDFYQARSGIYPYFERISKGDFSKSEPNTYVLKAIFEDKWLKKGTSASVVASVDSIKHDIVASFHRLQEVFKEFFLYKSLQKNIYPLAMVNEIEKILQDIRQQNNLIHISEFNKRITAIVLNEPVPFIYERLGELYHHYLIDEFQDTSVLQWLNLLPLVENSLSYNYKNLVVGDGKQAIYRWRGGDVEQFSKLPLITNQDNDPLIEEREQSFRRSYHEKVLGMNYRSYKEIVMFNNDFFEYCKKLLPEHLQNVYDKGAQGYDEKKSGGLVELYFVENSREKEVVDAQTFVALKERIESCVSDGFQYRDIAILCRSNSNASLIANYLLSENISVLSSESLLLKNSDKINFLMAFIQYLIDQSNQHAILVILNYLSKLGCVEGLDDYAVVKNLLVKEKEQNYYLLDYLKKHIKTFDFQGFLFWSPYDLCESLISEFKLEESPDVYVQQFLDTVLDLTQKKSYTLSDLPEWWEKQGKNIPVVIPEGIDAVQVLTIHKSKGLEFPVVMYPYAYEKSIRQTKSRMWVHLENANVSSLRSTIVDLDSNIKKTELSYIYDAEEQKSLLDRINLLYVALTRPTHRLYILSKKPTAKSDGARIEDFLWAYCSRSLPDRKDEKNKSFVWGSGQARREKDKEQKLAVVSLESSERSDWKKSLRIGFQHGQLWGDKGGDSARKWGNLVHKLLSEFESKDDIERLLTEYLLNGTISDLEYSELFALFDRLMENKEISHFFDNKSIVKNEAEIITPDGDVYRPDRVLIHADDCVSVIDYKTGKPDDKHKDQVSSYALVLQNMGYRQVNKYLIYLDEEVTIVKVENDDTAIG